jgi:hypothetical protein
MFDLIDTEEKAYWLGFIIADGSVRKHKGGSLYLKLALSSKDKNHLEKFKKFLKSDNKISTYKVGNSQTSEKIYETCEFQTGKKEITSTLEQYGIVPSKSFSIEFPDVSEELVRHLIRGIWDGDGSVLYRANNKKYPNNFSPEVQLCGNKYILDSVQNIFEQKLGIIPSKLSTVSSIFLFRKNTRPAKKIIEYLYKDSSIYLDRKYINAVQGMKWTPKYKKGV